MRAAFLLLRWELRRVFSNWRQTVSVFLVPSLVLLISLYAFPVLLNFISSGSIGRGAIVLVDPDPSFIAFTGDNAAAGRSNYEIISGREFSIILENGEAEKQLRQGRIFVAFSAFPFEGSTDAPGFSEAVRQYYLRLLEGNTEIGSTAFISITYDRSNPSSYANYLQFEADVFLPYEEYLVRALGGEYYASGGGKIFDINRVNPYTVLMSHRSVANPAASRVIPGILVLLAYYCVYSLAADTLAADRQRGFLSKIALTPIGTSSLLAGKAISVMLVSSISSVITLLVLNLSSWVNFSNSPNSLLPFGLIIFPMDLLAVVVTLLTVTFMMTAFCFAVILSLGEIRDVTLNLQIPLIFFLVEFFVHLFRPPGVVLIEYLIPAHNSLMILRDTISGELNVMIFAVVTVINLALAIFMFRYARNHFTPTAAGISETRRSR